MLLQPIGTSPRRWDADTSTNRHFESGRPTCRLPSHPFAQFGHKNPPGTGYRQARFILAANQFRGPSLPASRPESPARPSWASSDTASSTVRRPQDRDLCPHAPDRIKKRARSTRSPPHQGHCLPETRRNPLDSLDPATPLTRQLLPVFIKNTSHDSKQLYPARSSESSRFERGTAGGCS